jgi:transcriptional regulator with XRE-family HTH domain
VVFFNYGERKKNSFLREAIIMKNLNLKISRIVKNKSQYLLSYETGIPQTTISLLEQGLKQPRPEDARKLARALDSTVDELFPKEEACQCA